MPVTKVIKLQPEVYTFLSFNMEFSMHWFYYQKYSIVSKKCLKIPHSITILLVCNFRFIINAISQLLITTSNSNSNYDCNVKKRKYIVMHLFACIFRATVAV